jgi:SAM-dependent methyltransferase
MGETPMLRYNYRLMARLYEDLANWWPLVSDPADYAEEASYYARLLCEAVDPPPTTVLELGSGGGNNASHLKKHFSMTLVDRSAGMLAVSQQLNPDLQHIEGDMRTVRLDREFDAVFIHDAIGYMTRESDLRAAIITAHHHTRPGGAALFVPDFITENFAPKTDHGGHDGADRALRFVHWTFDPNPADTTYVVEYAFILRQPDGSTSVDHDRHLQGLFPRATWMRLLSEIGFYPRPLTDPWSREIFLATKSKGTADERR